MPFDGSVAISMQPDRQQPWHCRPHTNVKQVPLPAQSQQQWHFSSPGEPPNAQSVAFGLKRSFSCCAVPDCAFSMHSGLSLCIFKGVREQTRVICRTSWEFMAQWKA